METHECRPNPPTYKPGEIALRRGAPFELKKDRTWQRIVYAPVTERSKTTAQKPLPGRLARQACAQLPGAIFSEGGRFFKIDEHGIGRLLDLDNWPAVHSFPLPAGPKAPLPSHVMNLGRQPHQLVPDGSWRRVVETPWMAANAAPEPQSWSLPNTAAPGLVPPTVGGVLTASNNVQYRRHADGHWRLVTSPLAVDSSVEPTGEPTVPAATVTAAILPAKRIGKRRHRRRRQRRRQAMGQGVQRRAAAGSVECAEYGAKTDDPPVGRRRRCPLCALAREVRRAWSS